MSKQLPPEEMPTSLGGQMKLHVAAYVFGAVMLATFQFSMNRIDWLSKSAIDLVFGQNPVDSWRPAAMMLGLAVVAFGTRVSSRWFIFNAGRDVEYDLRALLLRKLHGLGAAFYRKMSAGEIMSRSTNDLTQVRLLTGFGVLNIINVVFGLGSAMQVMLGISPKLTIATMVTLPFLVLLTRTFSRNLFIRNRQNQDTLGKLSESLQTNLAGVRVVRSFALENRELQRFRVANDAYLEASLGLARLRGSMQPIMGATSAVGILIFFWYGGSLLLRGPADHGLSPGDFFAFSLALTRMMWPMVALGFALSIVQRGRAGHARLREVFEAIPEVSDGPNAPPEIVKGALRVEHLGFAYGDRMVLDDVSFDVPAGKSLAIVGRTGSGKSTAAMLLARLLPTPKNSVFIDDIDVCTVPLSFVRRALGYAQQDAFLFSTTVSRNIGYALPDAESEVGANIIRDAAREAQVLEEALGLPEQFDTVVGERGVQLSGGQKQRIALARALAWEPKILILDDPLSAVDAKTEAAILKSIERQAEKRTVVLITHRVAAAARCDEVIVLDQGRVIERGTHDELLANHGLYAAFAEEQRMARELAEMEAEPVPSEPPQAEKAGAA